MRSRTRQALATLAGGVVIMLATIMSGGLAATPARAAIDCVAGTVADSGIVVITFCPNGATDATGSPQSWTVPAGVSDITVDAYGAPGGWGVDGEGNLDAPGGAGGWMGGPVSVTPGDVWTISVGGNGGDQRTTADSTYGAGGYNGGGNGHAGDSTLGIRGGAGGGGATSMSGSGQTFIAGGGGGALGDAAGGDGGGDQGQVGHDSQERFAGGGGGSTSSGGTNEGTSGCGDGSVASTGGAAGSGGTGGLCVAPTAGGAGWGGPGGGGGRYGGGGGTSNGGGGGSGLISVFANLHKGTNSSPYGYATISFTQPDVTFKVVADHTSPIDISSGSVTVTYSVLLQSGGVNITQGTVHLEDDQANYLTTAVDAGGTSTWTIGWDYSTAGAVHLTATYTDPAGVYPDADDSLTLIFGDPPAAPSFPSSGVTRDATLGVPFSYTSPPPGGSPPPVIVDDGITVSDESIGHTTSGGQVTITSPGPVGTNTVAVKVTNGISPDATFTITINVAKQDTTTNVVSSDGNSVYGQPITFTATVHPGDSNDTASPGGTVTFRDGTTDLCSAVAVTAVSPATTPPTATASCTLASGSAALKALHNGTNTTITAEYSGDTTFNGSNDTTTQVVNAASTTTSLTVTAPPSSAAVTSSTYGQRITLTATVNVVSPSTVGPGDDPDSTKAGSVNFSYDSTAITGCQGIAVDASTSQATCVLDAFTNTADLAALHAGSHTLLAQYSAGSTGDFTSSQDSVSFMVTGAATTTHVGVVTPPSTIETTNAVYGNPFTLIATVNAVSPSTLDPSGVAGGVVSFSVDSSPIAGCQLVPLASGSNQAACVLNATTNAAVLAALHVGGHTFLASYTQGPVGDYAASEGSNSFTVIGVPTTTTVVVTSPPSDTAITSSIYGQPLTLTATVTTDGASTIEPADVPSPDVNGGTVDFVIDTALVEGCEDVALTAGTNQAVCVLDGTNNLAVLAALHAGQHVIEADFSSSGDYLDSDSTVQYVVAPAPTTTTLAAVPNPAVFGEAILFTATVTQGSASIIPPTGGTVVFDNLTTDEVPCVNTAAAGIAECGVAAGHLAPGSYNFTATYGGSNDYVGSASGIYTEVVSAAPTQTTASAVYYDFAPVPTVVITAEVHALPPSGADPGDIGAVSFFNGTTLLCTVPLDDNQAICEAVIDPSNTSLHSLTAIYNADGSAANYLSSSATTDAVAHFARPTIATVSAVPNSQAALGASWLVSGGGFAGATSVTVCGVVVPFTVINDNTLLIGIPPVSAPRQCAIVVMASGGVGSSNGAVTVVPQPQPGAVPVTIPGGSPSTPSASCTTATLTLSGQWTLIGWPGADTAVADALAGSADGCTTDVSSAIAVIWSFDSASQTWLAYFPGVTVPGANDLENLQRGMGYFVALNVPSNSVTWTVDTVPPTAG